MSVFPGKVSAAFIAERLRDSLPDADPGAVRLGRGSRDLPNDLQSRFVQPMKPAGVLIPILERRSGLAVLMTRRSSDLKHHAGQVSFPGGSMEDGDRDIRHTALRETHEEVGIKPSHINVAGCLPAMPTITGFAVTPVIGLVMNEVRLTLDRREVEDAFEVPLAYLLDARNEAWDERLIDNISVPVVEFRYGGQRIWGATASMVLALRQALMV